MMTQTALLKGLCLLLGYQNRKCIYEMCLVVEKYKLVTPVNVRYPSTYQWSRRLATLKCTGKLTSKGNHNV